MKRVALITVLVASMLLVAGVALLLFAKPPDEPVEGDAMDCWYDPDTGEEQCVDAISQECAYWYDAQNDTAVEDCPGDIATQGRWLWDDYGWTLLATGAALNVLVGLRRLMAKP